MQDTRNVCRPLDIIEFFSKRSPSIYDIIAPLYKKGLSVTEIAVQTGISRSSIWTTLRTNKLKLRPQVSVPFERWRLGRGKTRAKPPYGYSFFQGEVIKDPVEYPTLQLIQNLWKQGVSISAIVKRLNSKGVKSRMKKPWSYNVIKSIIGRLKDGSTDHLTKSVSTKKL